MTYLPGDLVAGKYRVVRLIGDGGMGSVYEARHEILGASVALKFLHAELAQRPGLSARFLQEARVSATIQSLHVARVTDVDSSQDGSPYLVMELLTGESLQKLLDRRGKLNQDQAVDFSLQILLGLEAAHTLGVVHRDLKPDNVFVTSTAGGPLLKLIDFGIAKLREASESKQGLTRAGVVMGTAEYMAPEQLYAASEVDHRADLYSLGVMLFEMLSGVRPADGDGPEAVVAKVLSGSVRKLRALAPNLQGGLDAVVERALAADRERRFSSAEEMRFALCRYAGELSPAGRQAVPSGERASDGAREANLPGAPGVHPRQTAFASPPAGQPLHDTLDAPVPGVRATLPHHPGVGARGGTTQAAPQVDPLVARVQPARARRRPNRTRSWIIALGLLLAVAVAVVVVTQIAERASGLTREPAQLPTHFINEEKPVEPIVIPMPTEDRATGETPAPDRPARPAIRPTIPSSTPQVDAPSTPPLPFPSFALPSTLPPLPSAFPPALPSFFRQLPGLSFPQPSPAPSSGVPAP